MNPSANGDAGVIRLHDVLTPDELPTQPYAPSTVVADPVTWGPELYELFTCQMTLEQQRKYAWVAVQFLLCGGWAGNQLSSMVRTYLLYDLAPVPAWAAT